MANSTDTQTINPEVMPSGSALPLKSVFTVPAGVNGFAWGVIAGIAATFAMLWFVKRKL